MIDEWSTYGVASTLTPKNDMWGLWLFIFFLLLNWMAKNASYL